MSCIRTISLSGRGYVRKSINKPQQFTFLRDLLNRYKHRVCKSPVEGPIQ
ncbi:hypothetical protein CCACVL1_03142 [Corchorus capsularis]|uniref:Uncharacterized protein n=1 Tax=Corchorus capsularis TaxID=210143 RepID=A0A1R3K2A0_COCAP|nr:hypothetical protein CCACVL1_03142 [Corchorus capsularis]